MTEPAPTPKRFSLDAFRRSVSRPSHPGHTDDERPVGHKARVMYALITGTIPPASPEPRKMRVPPLASISRALPGMRKTPLPPTVSAVPLDTAVEPGPRTEGARQGAGDACRPVPNVKPKTLKKLKADLVNADKARVIEADLHRMDVPLDDSFVSLDVALLAPATPGATGGVAQRKVSRGYAVPPLDDLAAAPPAPSTSVSSPDEGGPKAPFISFGTALPPTTPGGLGGLAAAKSGAFEILAGVTGALVGKSGAHDGVFALPQDRASVFVYWWGFEICLPPPAIHTLSAVASVQSTFFTFLQAFVLAGGAPEIAPFVRYISSYCDMEWQAIKAQNKGNGVVLAATWLVPVALVPRPWDFPLRLPVPALAHVKVA